MKEEPTGQFSVALMHGDGKYFLLLHKEAEKHFCIMGWPTLRAGLDYFEEGYAKNHRRGYEASMSACINFIQFQPRVALFKDLDDFKARLLPQPLPPEPTEEQAADAMAASQQPAALGQEVHTLRSVSGFYYVLPLVRELAEPVYAAATTPALI